MSITEGLLLERLDPTRADEVHALIMSLRSEETMPPGYELPLDDAKSMFDQSAHGELAEICGVFGTLDRDGILRGVVSVQPLLLDGNRWIEFMIFYDRSTWGTNLATDAGRQTVARIRAHSGRPVATLVYPRNERGKNYYAKLGFTRDREVTCEGYCMELWRLQ